MLDEVKKFHHQNVSEAIAFVAVIQVAKSGMSAKAELVAIQADGSRSHVMPGTVGEKWILKGCGTSRSWMLAEKVSRTFGVPADEIDRKMTSIYV